MIIDKSNCVRVRIASSVADIRSPLVLQNAHRTGDKRAAVRSAILDIECMGEGACFMVEQYTDQYGWQEVQCGEFKDGRYYPRNNF
jgi:hypothetical protein